MLRTHYILAICITYVLMAFIAGCFCVTPGTTMSGNQKAMLTLTPDSIGFGNIAVGTTSTVQVIAITNISDTPLKLGTISLSGNDKASFFMSNTCPKNVMAGASCTILVSFEPHRLGNATASITIRGSSTTNATETIPIIGTGTSALSISSSSFQFGEVPVGTNSDTLTITLTNSGNRPLQSVTVLLSGNNPQWFSASSNCPKMLNAGTSCAIQILFSPIALGLATASVSIAEASTPSFQVIPLTGSGIIPAATPVPPPSGAVSCTNFGCIGDGITDNTLALRAAIEYVCQQGGGIMYIPAGVYRVSIQSSDEIAALSINCGNITIQGGGYDVSILSVYAIHDSDPDAVCPLNTEGKVNRGSGIYVDGSINTVTSNVHIDSIRLTGNRNAYAGMSGSTSFPASPESCFNAWDVSNKGIFFKQDVPRKNNTVTNCEIDHFGGELIYGGGGSSSDPGQEVSYNILHNTNGDGISVSGGVTVLGNTIFEVAANGIENNSNAGRQTITNNVITSVGGAGLTLAPIAHVSNPPIWEVSDNIINYSRQWGILVGAEEAHVHDNFVLNSAWTSNCCYAALALFNDISNYPTSVLNNIELDHNTITVTSTSISYGIAAVMGDSSKAENISIHDNALQSNNSGEIKTPVLILPGITNLILSNNSME